MKNILNQLVQLQELYFTLDEQEIAGPGTRLEQLERSIQDILDKLPPDTAVFFQKLQRRDPPAIAPVVKQTCYGCGIELPISLGAEILRFDSLYQCPNCARFLYPYTGEKLNLHDDSLHHKLPRLGIDKFSSEKLMLPKLQSQNQEGIITELAHLISDQLYFDNPQILVEKALQREAIMSTAVKHSLAFPHVRGIDAGSMTFALGITKKGTKFGSPKNRLTKVIFFIIIPLATSAFYLKLIAGLIEALQPTDARKNLLSCSTEAELWKTLKKLTKKYIP